MEFDSTPEQESQFAEDDRSLTHPNNSEGYFVVGTTKLILMTICTLGIYELYWVYKNWKYIKAREQSNIMPFWRAFFAPLWVFSLGQKIKSHSAEVSTSADFDPNVIGVAYFIISALWRLPDPFWLVCFLSFIPILTLQTAASKINQALEVPGNKYYNFSTANYVILFFGGILFILALVGTFMPA